MQETPGGSKVDARWEGGGGEEGMCQGEEHLAETSGSAADTDGHSEE